MLWIAFITITFILPQINPVNSQTLNYAIVAVGIVLTYCMSFWVLSARKWFKGPIKQIAGMILYLLSYLKWLYLIDCFSFSFFCILPRIAEEMGIAVTEPGMLEKLEAEGKLETKSSA